MNRIVLLGNIASGKSTLARRLSRARGIPHIEIDQHYWQPDWSIAPSDTYNRHHDDAIAQDNWIIDGGGDLPSIQRRVERATELILLDFPIWVHFWRAAKRQMAWANGTLEHPPGGGHDMPPTGPLFEIIWQVDRDWTPKLRSMCHDQRAL